MADVPAEAYPAGIPREGEVVGERYRVEHLLGVGGMGAVVAAQHLELGLRVALKFLLPEIARDEAQVARFLGEARTMARIGSEHVVRVVDLGDGRAPVPFLVMEYLSGTDLRQLVALRGRRAPAEARLPVRDAVDYVLQASEAIAEAHAAGVVHRDLKPGNLFLTRRADGSPLVKVLDFGICKQTAPGDAAPGVTAAGVALGSPLYMSPEQVRSAKDVDARTDIWSLGVILHELVTGRHPFEAETASAALAAIAADPPAPLRAHLRDAPAALEEVVRCCLEKSPARRYQSLAELARALEPFAPEGAKLSIDRVVRTVGVRGDATAATTMPAPESHAPGAMLTDEGARALPSSTPPAPRPALRIAVGVAAAGLALAGVLRVTSRAAGDARAPRAATSAGAPAALPLDPGQGSPPAPASAEPAPASAEPTPAASASPRSTPSARTPRAPPRASPPPVDGGAHREGTPDPLAERK